MKWLRMDPSAAEADSDDGEMLSVSPHADVLLSLTTPTSAQQQYDCHAGPSSVPVWSDCFPVQSFSILKPTDGDMHAAADFMSSMPQGKRSPFHQNFQSQVYNFLERPTGWKCFLYHFSV